MLILVALFFTLSFIFPQGMYIEKNDKPVYSLNILYNSLNRTATATEIEHVENYYGLSLSYIFKGNNEFSLGYKLNEDSKIISTSYLYYIKPDFYLNMFSGVSYEYVQKNSNINENKYSAKVGIYGNKQNSENVELGLQYFPFFIYDYFYVSGYHYDAITFGCSFLFNDIGIEPSYIWIDNNTSELSLKIYLWEFGN